MYFFSVLACTVSSLFNELLSFSVSFWVFPSGLRLPWKSQKSTSTFLFRNPLFERGCKGKHYFLISKFLFKIFQFIFSCFSLSKNFHSFTSVRFSNGVAKVGIIFWFPNLFSKIFQSVSSCLSLFKNSLSFRTPFSQTGLQRYDFFPYFQIYAQQILTGLVPKRHSRVPNPLPHNALYHMLHFC